MKLNLAVIFGGRSVEHEISVLSAQQCIAAVDKNKYTVIPIYISKQGQWYTGDKLLDLKQYCDIDKLLAESTRIVINQNSSTYHIYKEATSLFSKKHIATIDIAIPVTHGTYGEDGCLQGLLETMNIPYVGCNVLSSAIAMDKIATKMLLRSADIQVLDDTWFYAHEWIKNKDEVVARIKQKFNYPIIVKPSNAGSSVGISSVDSDDQIEDAIDLAISMSQRILVEPKVVNLKEVNCSILGDAEEIQFSVCEEPIRGDTILSYQDKYLSGAKSKFGGAKSGGMSSAKRKIPADISEKLNQQIKDMAKQAFLALNCNGVVRIDFLIDQNTQQVYLCEVNTIPGSLSFYLWQPMGLDFTALIEKLIELALKRHRQNSNLSLSYNTNILRNFQSMGGKG